MPLGGRERWISKFEASFIYRACSGQPGMHKESLPQKNSNNKNLFILLYVCLCFACMYVCIPRVLGALRGQKKASELQL